MSDRTSKQARRGSANNAEAINYAGGDQTLTNAARGIYISSAGNLAVRFAGDTADVTLTGLLAGSWYPFAVKIIRNASSTAAGLVLY